MTYNSSSNSQQSPPSVRELIVASLLTFLFVAAGYFMITAYNSHLAASGYPFKSLSTWLDVKLPFVPEFIVFYYSYYLVVFSVAVLGYRNRQLLYQAIVGYLGITAVAWITFALLPIRMQQADLAHCVTVFCGMVRGIYEVDAGYNVLPSLHVGHSFMVFLFFYRYERRWSPLVGFLTLGITFSTVLIKQHYLLDIPPGFLVGWLGYWAGVNLGQPVAEQTSKWLTERIRSS